MVKVDVTEHHALKVEEAFKRTVRYLDDMHDPNVRRLSSRVDYVSMTMVSEVVAYGIKMTITCHAVADQVSVSTSALPWYAVIGANKFQKRLETDLPGVLR